MSKVTVHKPCVLFHRWGGWGAPYEARPLECESMMICKDRKCIDCGRVEVHTIRPA
jgi:hypothetical protein